MLLKGLQDPRFSCRLESVFREKAVRVSHLIRTLDGHEGDGFQ